jgi:uncharacterized protein (TIGR01319 family)
MARVLCVDFGSTFTKAALVDTAAGEVLATREVPTTIETDVLDGYRAIRASLGSEHQPQPEQVLACSSAGGGLRLAVVGYEREVTAQAGWRVGLSAGAKVVHVASGLLSGPDVHDLRGARPDIVLLVGGTDGGNADVLLHNAERLAHMRVAAPIVVAGNADAADEVAAVLAASGRRFEVTDNVLPQIGVIAPKGARAAIRAAFLHHVIGGKHLSKGTEFVDMVRAATPDAVLAGVQVLADSVDGDVLVIDVGGATTDVYSALQPQGEDAGLAKDVVAPLWQSRTVEADLGMRWSAEGVLEAAHREALPVSDELPGYAARVARETAHLPAGPGEQALDLELARLAAMVAVRRHARPASPGASPRLLADVVHVIGSGGVLRHAETGEQRAVLRAVTGDHAGGWRVPREARVATDTAYLLFAVGLLAEAHPDAAGALAVRVVGAES